MVSESVSCIPVCLDMPLATGMSCPGGLFLQAMLLPVAMSFALLAWITKKTGEEKGRLGDGPGEANVRTRFYLRFQISIAGAGHIYERTYSAMVRNRRCRLWGQPRSTAGAGGRT